MLLNDKDVLSTVSVDKCTLFHLPCKDFYMIKAELTVFLLLIVLYGHMNQQEKILKKILCI